MATRSFAFVLLATLVGCVADEVEAVDESEIGSGSGSGCFTGSGSASAAFTELLPVTAASSPSIAVEGYTPWLAYIDQGQLRVARRVSTWTTQTIDSASAGDTSIAVSGSTLHASYIGAGSQLRYAKRSAGTWTTEDVGPYTGIFYNALAVDSAGVPHAAFFRTGGQLVYAVRGATGWTQQQIAAVGSASARGPIAITTYGRSPRIAYLDLVTREVHYMTLESTGWTNQVVRVMGLKYNAGFRQNVSLTLDYLGSPRLAWRDDARDRIQYATLSNGIWTVEDASEIESGYPVIAQDCSSAPHLIYEEQGLIHSTRSSWWNYASLDAAFGTSPAAAIDTQPRIHAVHIDTARRNIRYTSSPF